MNPIRFERLPYGSSSWRIDFQCPVCGCPGSKRVLKRRVHKYQAKLRSAVAVTVSHRCNICGIKGHHRVRIDGNRVHRPTVRGVS